MSDFRLDPEWRTEKESYMRHDPEATADEQLIRRLAAVESMRQIETRLA